MASDTVRRGRRAAASSDADTTFGEMAWGFLRALASLKFTVALFAMAAFLVFVGTLAQAKVGTWDAVNTYFRNWSFVWVEFDVFFPRAFFPDKDAPVPGVFPYPGGWLLGLLMLVNLLAAHGLRFTTKTRGPRLYAGLGVITLGVVATVLVILSGHDSDGVQARLTAGFVENLWHVFVGGLVLAWIGVGYGLGTVSVKERSVEWWTLAAIGAALSAVLLYVFWNGAEAQLSGRSMRILWQLAKAGVAAGILLAGCILVFKKRAGIVLLHAGVGLLMVNELTANYVDEGIMRIREGETLNYAQDLTDVELAIVDESDPKQDRHVVVPASRLQDEGTISDEQLPFDVEVLDYMVNSVVQPPDKGKNPATEGFGRLRVAREIAPVPGVESDRSDIASVYVRLKSKETGEDLGTWLFSQTPTTPPQDVRVDGKTYSVELRFERLYKPYWITLNDVQKNDYIGTTTPRDYSSFVDIRDPETRYEAEDVRIWMNNPLRYAGETFYQNGYQQFEVPKQDANGRPVVNPRTGRPEMEQVEIADLQIVTNTGWMIPYTACMIVAFGMLAQFLLTLMRYLDRRRRGIATAERAPPSDDGETFELAEDPNHPAHRFDWATTLVPVVVLGLAVLFVGRLAMPPKVESGAFDVPAFGRLPVTSGGRVKPIDSLARNTMTVLAKRQAYKPLVEDTASGSSEKVLAERSEPATDWLLDAVAGMPAAEEAQIFRIENGELLGLLRLEERPGWFRYSLDELVPRMKQFNEVTRTAREKDADDWNTFERKAIELSNQIGAYHAIRLAFLKPDEPAPLRFFDRSADAVVSIEGDLGYLAFVSGSKNNLQTTPFAVPTHDPQQPWEPYAMPVARQWVRDYAAERDLDSLEEVVQSVVAEAAENRDPYFEKQVAAQDPNDLAKMAASVDLARIVMSTQPDTSPDQARRIALQLLDDPPPQLKPMVEAQLARARDRIDVRAYVTSVLEMGVTEDLVNLLGEDFDFDAEESPEFESWSTIIAAYQSGDPESFNAAVAEYKDVLLAERAGPDDPSAYNPAKTRFEAWFNQFAPFFWGQWLYLLVFVLAALSWLGWEKPLGRASFWLLLFTFALHTAALVARIYISGRPPVTNLYSSAVFIGWGCAVLAIVFDLVYRIGMGKVVGGVIGFLSLGVAHYLAVTSSDPDTFTVMQAVLDTQFWLATHVVCITLGYSVTFLAGFFGLMFILRGLLTPSLSPAIAKDLGRMIYGTLCFAIFFSFVGTVLGGLWADDSWGRFWGWDPKENGALIIVLWNALVLHARWDGMVKERGMAVLAVMGNIVTAWSWFGTNELKVGLHSYGFTEGVLMALGVFAASQIVVAGLGCLPKRMWWSYSRNESPATTNA